MNRRRINEKKYTQWSSTESGGRVYKKEIKGKHGWIALYIKIVDKNEVTLEFIQKIYNEEGVLVEIHKKYPKDEGHKKL